MPAVSRFGGLALLGFVACWTTPATPPSNTPAVTESQTLARDVRGRYWCSISESGYRYPPFPCVIEQAGNRLRLDKLGGSQRVRGRIKLDDRDGFTFAGELYCPWGDCTKKLHGRFRPIGHGGFEGRFREDEMVIRMMPATRTAAFGGAAYGGVMYGGAMYGGAMYGGNGGVRNPYRVDSRGRRRP